MSPVITTAGHGSRADGIGRGSGGRPPGKHSLNTTQEAGR